MSCLSKTTLTHKSQASPNLNFSVIICSTSRFKEFTETGRFEDTSGDTIAKILEESGHRVTARIVVPDSKSKIQHAVLRSLKSRKVDAIITCGGTGISPKDVTIEAVKPLFEKEMPGFGELFRSLSYRDIGSAAILTRSIAGIADKKAIFCIPGSPYSISVALNSLVLLEVGHILKHSREE